MTSTQLATMIIIHEFRHQFEQDEESGKALLEIYSACIKWIQPDLLRVCKTKTVRLSYRKA